MSAAISSSVRPSPAVRTINPPRGADTMRLQNSLQPVPFFIARDLARNAQVIDARHVDHVASRQRDVRSDARALLAQRLFGNLNDDFLAGLQQIGDRWKGAIFFTRATLFLYRRDLPVRLLASRRGPRPAEQRRRQ